MQISKTILIVDDDTVANLTMARQLELIGYTTVSTRDAAEAISSVRNAKPDLILVKVALPPDVGHGGGAFSDGFLLVSWLRRINEATAIPVVMINGDDCPEHINRARAVGAVGFFPKPINYEGLVALVVRKLGEPVPQAVGSA